METAKVDIRRLQMLNDRINQTLDALNQVRLTVHGIQHSSMGPGAPFGAQFGQGQFGQSPFGQGQFGQSPFGQGQFGQSPFGQAAWGTSPFGASPYGMHGAYPYGPQSLVPGVSHTSPFGTQSPYGFGSSVNPMLNPLVNQQWGMGIGGLSHTSPESIDPSVGLRSSVGYDPYYVQRVAQTFPFVQWGYSPFSNGIV